MSQVIVIPARLCGPPTSGNGGYTCGLLAANIGRCAEVTLRKPIPLEREMEVKGNGSVKLLAGEELIAEGTPADFAIMEAPRVSFEEAQKAAAESPAFHQHPFPTCFVCGPERRNGDGLRIFPGPAAAHAGFENLFAAPWVPDASLADENGNVRDEYIWASLDCPTGFAGGFPYEGKLVTGRMAVKLIAPVRPGEKCVLVSWRLGIEGRKHLAAA